jgi:hypothetical protein
MSTKIIQDRSIPRLAPAVGVAATSVPIALSTGYLRVTIGSTTSSSGGYIAIGTDPVATQDNYHITSYSVDIIKETLRKQRIVGVTTGTTTTLFFGENNGTSFLSTDYITISGAPTAGINTTHKAILSSSTDSITIDFNSSSIVSPNITGASASRSVKVSCLTYEPDTFFNIAEVVQLVSE